MDDKFLEHITENDVLHNIGPNGKEILLQHAEIEYCNGNATDSIFYQVLALYQCVQEQLYQDQADEYRPSVNDLIMGMSSEETKELKNNCLLKLAATALKKDTSMEANNNPSATEECNFLKGISDPKRGIQILEKICKQLPKEWTVIQLCKGPCEETTFSIFPKIHESEAAIYMTLLKHSRSDEYPTPICLRFAGEDKKDLFENFAGIIHRLKKCINVDPKEWNNNEMKKLYNKLMNDLNVHMAAATAKCLRHWHQIDGFCDQYELDKQCRVILSLAAEKIINLSAEEIEAICEILIDDQDKCNMASRLLNDMRLGLPDFIMNVNECYPCILVVDERLDHFFWEEINVLQEYSRVPSLQCLWRLYSHYKKQIEMGYLKVNVTHGGYIVNPDQNLPKMELRMSKFYEYWLPHWNGMIGERPTQEALEKFFSNICYVYSGHGSGLQYLKGSSIAKLQMNCVVFLFGCDSSRLHSNGLYSELVGPHLYYHAAMCPAFVGTLLPCLDASMDKVASEILSRWIAPNSKKVLPWDLIEENVWVKEGIIELSTSWNHATYTTMATTVNYHMGSLCGIVAKVHQRLREARMHNTVPYVCRGLPVWNCHVEPLTNSAT